MADFYIRSWDPDSTYPPNPQEGDVCYTITLDQSWSPVAGVKNDNLLKEEVYENGEWKEVGGGTQGDDEMKVYELDEYLAIPNGSDVIADIEAGIWPVIMYNNNGARLFWFALSASASSISAYGSSTQTPGALTTLVWNYNSGTNKFALQS